MNLSNKSIIKILITAGILVGNCALYANNVLTITPGTVIPNNTEVASKSSWSGGS